MNDVTKQSKISDLFRERVREEIARQDTTISAVASQAGISFVHLSRVLSGKADVSLPIAEQIADSLGVELSDLISGKISA
jgi:transcriptional regulator with XRE-family HTH domain